MGKRKSRGQILRDIELEIEESKDVIRQGRMQNQKLEQKLWEWH